MSSSTEFSIQSIDYTPISQFNNVPNEIGHNICLYFCLQDLFAMSRVNKKWALCTQKHRLIERAFRFNGSPDINDQNYLQRLRTCLTTHSTLSNLYLAKEYLKNAKFGKEVVKNIGYLPNGQLIFNDSDTVVIGDEKIHITIPNVRKTSVVTLLTQNNNKIYTATSNYQRGLFEFDSHLKTNLVQRTPLENYRKIRFCNSNDTLVALTKRLSIFDTHLVTQILSTKSKPEVFSFSVIDFVIDDAQKLCFFHNTNGIAILDLQVKKIPKYYLVTSSSDISKMVQLQDHLVYIGDKRSDPFVIGVVAKQYGKFNREISQNGKFIDIQPLQPKYSTYVILHRETPTTYLTFWKLDQLVKKLALWNDDLSRKRTSKDSTRLAARHVRHIYVIPNTERLIVTRSYPNSGFDVTHIKYPSLYVIDTAIKSICALYSHEDISPDFYKITAMGYDFKNNQLHIGGSCYPSLQRNPYIIGLANSSNE